MLKGVLGIVLPFAIGAALIVPWLESSLRQLEPPRTEAPAPRGTAATASVQPPPLARAPGGLCARGEEIEVLADGAGHFRLSAEIDGHALDMMVDTGATGIVLPEEEARRLGLVFDSFRRARVSTANGTVEARLAGAGRLRIGPICLDDIDIVVMPEGALSVPLLGMSAIRRLSRFEMSGARLILAH